MNEQFHWTSASGVEITLPKMDKIKGGLIRRYRKLDPVDFVFSLIEDLVDADTLALVDDLDSSEVNDLFEKWQSDTGASVGKSSSSST